MRLLTLLLLLPLMGMAQSFPKDYFAPPLRCPVSLTGGFAEIRPNHFHSGIDLGIGGKVGEPVYAPADGWVSRINISPWGGGKVLYIDHPNGYRTVYMHLNDFEGSAAAWVRDYQYAHHCYAFDTVVPAGLIPVRKGQMIAHGGNTGSSGGPHLHYEIRYCHNDETINPLLFGLPYDDNAAPRILGLRLYPTDDNTLLNGKHAEADIRLKGADTIHVEGRFHCGIYTYDLPYQGARNKNGVHTIELYVDGQLTSTYSNIQFLFEDTRAVNALIDYPEYCRSRQYYILSRTLRGAPHPWLFHQGDGTFTLSEGLHTLKYVASDHKGNSASHSFYVIATPSLTAYNQSATEEERGLPIAYHKPFELKREALQVHIPAGTLYANDRLLYSTSRNGSRHTLTLLRHPLPPHQSITIRMLAPDHPKALIVNISGTSRSALATKRNGNWLEAKSRSWGSFEVALDTVAPQVTPLNFGKGKQLKERVLRVKITDDLAGLSTYHCYINGTWQLGEYDGKTSTLSVSTAYLKSGSNAIRVVATDACGNSAEVNETLVKH